MELNKPIYGEQIGIEQTYSDIYMNGACLEIFPYDAGRKVVIWKTEFMGQTLCLRDCKIILFQKLEKISPEDFCFYWFDLFLQESAGCL